MLQNAGWFNLIPQLPDFAGAGLSYAVGGMNNERYKRSVRHLRRREYQDMVFSLKQAGLNPALAFGATPGHAGGFQGQGYSPASGAGVASAMAGLSQADTASKLAPSQIDVNTATAGERRELAFNERYRRASILQEYDKNAAWIEQTLQAARTSAAQEALFEAQMKQAGASESEIRERTEQINRFGLPGQSWSSPIRQWIFGEGAAAPITNNANPTKIEEAMDWLYRNTRHRSDLNPWQAGEYK